MNFRDYKEMVSAKWRNVEMSDSNEGLFTGSERKLSKNKKVEDPIASDAMQESLLAAVMLSTKIKTQPLKNAAFFYKAEITAVKASYSLFPKNLYQSINPVLKTALLLPPVFRPAFFPGLTEKLLRHWQWSFQRRCPAGLHHLHQVRCET